MRPRARYLVGVVLIAAAHFGAAKLSLEFAFVGNVSAIWLPAGVGIGALVAFGLRYWPAILLGETFAISTSGVPLGVALAEIAGNTLAALLGAGIVIGALRGRRTLTRLRDVVALVAFAAPTSALVSASIGVSSLVAGGVIPSTSFLHVWQRWLLADVTGVIVVAPALIVLADQRLRWLRRERALEAFALVAALAAVAPLAFVWAHGRPYFALPVLLWAAVRFLQPGAALGFAPDELRKLGLDQLVHPDELPAVRALLESAAAREERPALEARIRSRSGAWVRIEGVATPILDEDGSPVMSSPRRVT